MGFINLSDKTINAKLVYYGVGIGGKTTSLKAVHGIMCPQNEVKLVSINTEQDSTLLFDFLPIDLGKIEGFKIRVRGFTVPGQAQYVVMRKYVLSGADAVVLVIDTQEGRVEENLQAIEDLKVNLKANGLDWEKIPLIIQYNKRDLPNALPKEKLDELFLFRDVPTFETVATDSEGVFEAFIETVGCMVTEKVSHYGLGKGKIEPGDVAMAAKDRLMGFLKGDKLTEGENSSNLSHNLVDVTVAEDAVEDLKESQLVDEDRDPEPEKEDLPRPKLRMREGTAPEPVEKLEILDEFQDCGNDTPAMIFQADSFTDPKEALHPALFRFPEAGKAMHTLGDLLDVAVSGQLSEEASNLLGQAIASNMELANLYAQLADYKSFIEKKNRELVETNQLICHDLGKPLTVFKTVLGLLSKEILGTLNPKQLDALHNARESVSYMEDLIGDLLEASRVDWDPEEFRFEEIDLTILVGSLMRRLKYHLEEEGVRIRVEPLPIIHGDRKALTKIFMNLIGNAINYADKDKDRRSIIIGSREKGEHWVVDIADNGIGIPSENQKTIFEKFKRGDNTSGIVGTGLGLYLVKQYVTGHGGHVEVSSESGEGTTFSLHFPKMPITVEHIPGA